MYVKKEEEKIIEKKMNLKRQKMQAILRALQQTKTVKKQLEGADRIS